MENATLNTELHETVQLKLKIMIVILSKTTLTCANLNKYKENI